MGRKPKAANVKSIANVMSGDSNPPQKSMRSEQNMSNPGSSLKKKATMNTSAIVRRSGRLRKLISPIPNNKILAEEIDIVDCDGQEEPHVEEFDSEPISSPQNFEEKIDDLVQSVHELKTMVTKRPFPSENHSTELNYKNLYFDSQKKIEALTEENRQLSEKLQFAFGKIEAYEQMKDALGNLNDVTVVSNLGRATEALINLSSQVAIMKCPAPASLSLVPDEANGSPLEKKRRGRKKKQGNTS